MLRLASHRMLPAVRSACKLLQAAPNRNLWNFPTTDFRSMMREMDRQFDRLERDVFDRFPLRNIAPRVIPVVGSEPVPYRVNIDVGNFKPEEINVSVKDRVLTIRAKMERNAEDGSKFYQEVSREITLPENLNGNELKSFLNHDGVLTIEAPYKPQEKPKEIPVNQNK